jgi:hypothetical protein
MLNHDTRSSSGYSLRGIALHETLTAPRKETHHVPTYDGGLSFWAAVALMLAGAAGTVWVVEVVKAVYPF